MLNSRQTVLLVLLLIACNLQTPVQSQSASEGQGSSASQAMSLDLSSEQRNFTAPTAGSVQTPAGTVSFNAGDSITAAQFAALMQGNSISTSNILTVDAAGRALSGTFSLASLQGNALHDVIVPQNVTILGAHSGSSLSITGNLINSGTFLALPNGAATTFSLTAAMVQNNAGAIISSIVPTNLLGSIAQPLAAINLNINTLGSLVNLGSISSSGVLSVNAGGAIINGAAGVTSPQAVMSGLLGTNLNSAIGNIVNTGTITSQLGNVAITTALARDLSVNNVLGNIIANAGTVSFSNLNPLVKGDMNLSGGLVQGTSIEFNSNDGVVRAFLDEIRGPVDVNAGEVHLAVAGGELALRRMNLTGDPSFLNSNGNITLFPDVGFPSLTFAGQDLAIIASGDIVADASLTEINLGGTTRGGNLFIAAGYNISVNTGGATQTEPPVIPGGYNITGKSATGGSVRLGNVDIITTASNAGARAGNVTIIAHDDNNISENTFAANDKGTIEFRSINASSPTGTGGNVLVAAQSSALNLNQLIRTNGSSAAQSGSLALLTGEAVATGVSFINGTQTAGTVTVNNDAAHDAVTMTLNNTLDGGSGNIYSSVLLNSSGTLTLGPATIGQSNSGFTIQSRNGDVIISNDSSASANGGILSISAGKGVNLGQNTFYAASNGVNIVANNGSIQGAGQNTIYSFSDMFFTALGGDITFGPGPVGSYNELDAARSTTGNMTFATTGKIDLQGQHLITAANSVFMVAGESITTGTGGINAGALNPGVGVALELLPPGSIRTAGGIFLSADNDVTVNSGLQSAGFDTMLVSRTANIQLNNVTIRTDGANATLLAAGNVIGSGNNNITVRAAGTAGSFGGGVVQVTAGFPIAVTPLALTNDNTNNANQITTIQADILQAAGHLSQFKSFPDNTLQTPPTDPSGVITPAIIGSNVVVSSAAQTGLIAVDNAGGVVDLSNSTINLIRGAVFLDALNGKTIDLQNSNFFTSSYNIFPTQSTIPQPPLSRGLAAFVAANNIQIGQLNNLQANSNINLIGERQTRITIFLGDEKNKPGSSRNGNGDRAADGKQTDNIFDSKSFQGFDTGRIEISHKSLLPASRFQIQSGAGGLAQGSGRTGAATSGIGLGSFTALSGGGPRGGNVNGGNFAPIGILSNQGQAMSPVRVSQQRSDLVLFTTAGQVMQGNIGGSTNATAIGGAGTTVSDGKEGLMLHGGKLYANSGKTPMTVVTVYGTITIAPETTAAIEVAPDGSGRLIVLGGKEGEKAVSLDVGKQTLALAAGEQARIEPGTGEDQQEPSSDSPLRGTIIKEQVPVKRLIEKENEGFYSNRSIRLSGNASGAYQRMLDRINKWSGPESADSHAQIRPAQRPTGVSVISNRPSTVAAPAHVLASAGTIYQHSGDSAIDLSIGSLFIKPDSMQTIKTALGDLQVDPGAGAEVQVSNAGQVRFRSYSGPGKVRILAAGRNMILSPGQEIVLQKQKPTRNEALPNDGIARRSLANFTLPNGVNGVAGDFSILSSMQAEPHLKPLIRAERRDNAQLKADMLKMAASLNFVRASQGRYYMAAPEKSSLPNDAFIEQPSETEQFKTRVSYASED